MYQTAQSPTREQNREWVDNACRESTPTHGQDGGNGAEGFEWVFLDPPLTDVPEAPKPSASATRVGHMWFLLQHLRERKVVQWMLAYLGGTWMVLEATDVLSEIWGWPLIAQRTICLSLGLGSLPALVLAWYHGEKGRQRMTVLEILMLAGILVGSGTVLWRTCVSQWREQPIETPAVAGTESWDGSVVTSESDATGCPDATSS